MTDPFESLFVPLGRSEPSPAYRQRLATEIHTAFTGPDQAAPISSNSERLDARAPVIELPILEVTFDTDIHARPAWQRRLFVGAAVAASIIAVVALAVSRSNDNSRRPLDPATTTETTTSKGAPTTTATGRLLPPPVTLDPGGLTVVPDGYTTIDYGAPVAVGDGVLFVVNVEGGVGRYDVGTGQLLGGTALPGDTCTRPMYAFGSLWTATCSSKTLLRVDGRSGVLVATIALPLDFIGDVRDGAFTATDTDVWVLSDTASSVAVRVDPVTNTVGGSVNVPDRTESLLAGFGGLWTAQPTAGTVTRLDPAAGTTMGVVDVVGHVLTVGSAAVWALDAETATVHRIDPATNRVIADISVDDVGSAFATFASIEATDSTVWVQMAGAPLAVIDPATNTVTGRYESRDHGGIAIDEHSVWISETGTKRIRRVAPS